MDVCKIVTLEDEELRNCIQICDLLTAYATSKLKDNLKEMKSALSSCSAIDIERLEKYNRAVRIFLETKENLECQLNCREKAIPEWLDSDLKVKESH